MAWDGAGIIDVGGESTRPGAVPVGEAEELRRVIPVIEDLAGRLRVPISIDTMKPAVARAALRAGASIVNDVAANREDTEMWELVAREQVGYVCMHMRGLPATMQNEPTYRDVPAQVEEFFVDRLKHLNRCGVGCEQVILDPGIGFGKTPEHNVSLLASVSRFVDLGCPLLVGVSRKSFLGKLTGADAGSRLPAGLACACLAVGSGARFIRTHDVEETVQAIRMTEAILAGNR
jgi:dihydropteroate synthase